MKFFVPRMDCPVYSSRQGSPFFTSNIGNQLFITRTHLALALLTLTLCPPQLGVAAVQRSIVPVVPLTSPSQRVLTESTLGVVVNLNDASSITLGDFYIKSRDIPANNRVEVRLPVDDSVSLEIMQQILSELTRDPRYPSFVALALAFDRPYRVGEDQSITSAFSQGVAPMAWQGSCNPTPVNPDYASPPGAKLRSRPAMLLYGGGDLESSLDLVRRGSVADSSEPTEKILLMRTSDRARSSPREKSMNAAKKRLSARVSTYDFFGKLPTNLDPVLGFQTGLAKITDLSNIQFVPGAFADSLTSFGGALGNSRGQIKASDLIRAGATASYGTVREPCNFAEKFPDPLLLAGNYLNGDTILEAYWKSVGSVTEGLFIGEPLTRPFSLLEALLENDTITLKANGNTRSYIFDGSKSHGTIASPTTEEIRVYALEAGIPVFLKTVTIDANIREGDTIATISLSKARSANLTIGILKTQTTGKR